MFIFSLAKYKFGQFIIINSRAYSYFHVIWRSLTDEKNWLRKISSGKIRVDLFTDKGRPVGTKPIVKDELVDSGVELAYPSLTSDRYLRNVIDKNLEEFGGSTCMVNSWI
jgi:hypothetical protein